MSKSHSCVFLSPRGTLWKMLGHGQETFTIFALGNQYVVTVPQQNNTHALKWWTTLFLEKTLYAKQYFGNY